MSNTSKIFKIWIETEARSVGARFGSVDNLLSQIREASKWWGVKFDPDLFLAAKESWSSSPHGYGQKFTTDPKFQRPNGRTLAEWLEWKEVPKETSAEPVEV